MLRLEYKTVDGKTAYFLEPENEEDVKIMQKLQRDGNMSSRNSFGDWKGNK